MRELSYLIVPYDPDATGRLQPGAPSKLGSDDALSHAAIHAGIAVIGMPSDEGEEPSLVAVFGRVSAATLEIFKGAMPGRGAHVLNGARAVRPRHTAGRLRA